MRNITNMKCEYRIIVSIDGGGIRGVVPLKILACIQELAHELDPTLDISSLVDIYAGSSTSSVIGGALLLKNDKGKSIHTPISLLNFYLERGKQIFNKKSESNTQSSKYPFNFVLEHFFGNITVEEIKKHFLFVSYDLNSDNQFLFTDTIDRYRHVSLSKIMQGCSASPGISPPLYLGNLQLVDGMIAAKNPSILAYNYAKKLYPNDPIVLISLGTGKKRDDSCDMFEKEILLTDDELYSRAKTDNKLIYFRFQPTIKTEANNWDDHSKENTMNLINDTEDYIQSHRPKFDRLLSLIKIKAGIEY